jgi:hypothetical protein
MTVGWFRRAWRSPIWWKPVAGIAALLIAVSLVAFSWTSWQYRIDREDAFNQQQAEVVALRTELQCRVGQSSGATRIEGEIAREGWLALTIWARTGDSDHPRIALAAERVETLYRELGPALEQRAGAVERCD